MQNGNTDLSFFVGIFSVVFSIFGLWDTDFGIGYQPRSNLKQNTSSVNVLLLLVRMVDERKTGHRSMCYVSTGQICTFVTDKQYQICCLFVKATE